MVLVRTAFKIKSFFKKRDAEEFINTEMLTRHAVAFGCFLGSLVVFLLADLLTLFKQSKGVVVAVYLLNFIYFVSGLVSMVYLCAILWSLGTNVPPETDHQQAHQEDEEDYA